MSRENVLRSLTRAKSKTRPPLPNTAEQLVINEHYSITHESERFLFVDEMFDGERLLLFCSEFFLSLLFTASIICCDGTFQTVPTIFTQLFILNLFYNGKLLPAVYVLTKRKNALLYRRLFELLNHHARNRRMVFSPKEIVTDFEEAELLAINEEFPTSQYRECYFYFCQVIYYCIIYIKSIIIITFMKT